MVLPTSANFVFLFPLLLNQDLLEPSTCVKVVVCAILVIRWLNTRQFKLAHLCKSESLYRAAKSTPIRSSAAGVEISSIHVAGLRPSRILGTPGMFCPTILHQ